MSRHTLKGKLWKNFKKYKGHTDVRLFMATTNPQKWQMINKIYFYVPGPVSLLHNNTLVLFYIIHTELVRDRIDSVE